MTEVRSVRRRGCSVCSIPGQVAADSAALAEHQVGDRAEDGSLGLRAVVCVGLGPPLPVELVPDGQRRGWSGREEAQLAIEASAAQTTALCR